MNWLSIAAAVATVTTHSAGQDGGATGIAAAPPQIDVIKVRNESYDRLTVPVTVEGQGPFRFMIDTGAQATILSRDLADRLGVTDRKPATLIGISSTAPIEVAPVMSLELGTRRYMIETVPLVEKDNIGDADGILGLDSLQDQRVLLDFRNRTFSVADADSLGGNRGYDIVVRARPVLGQLVITSAELDGIKVAVIVGSGAQGSVGNIALQQRLRGRSLGDAVMTDINGVTNQSEMKLTREVRIGKARISNIPLTFVDSPSFKALGLDDKPAMVLGMNELRLFKRVAIDFKQRKVLFDLPSGADWHSASGGSH